MNLRPFLTLLKMEILAWLRVKINLFFILVWPVLWMLMMTLVIPAGDRGSPADVVLFYFPSCIALVILSAMISLSIRITIKKEGRILQRLQVVPFPIQAFFIVQFLCAIFMSILGVLCISILAVIMQIHMKGSLVSLSAVFLLGCFVFSGIGFFIAGISRKVSTSNILTMLVMFVMMFMSDMFIPTFNSQGIIYMISSFLPAAPFLTMMRGIMISGMKLLDYGFELWILIFWGIVPVFLSILTFKYDVK